MPVSHGAAFTLSDLIRMPLAAETPAAVQGAVSAEPTAGLPTETVSVPIVLTLDPGVTAATLGMTLSVAAVNGAPALRRAVSFVPAAALPAPEVLTVQSNDTVRIEWTTPWSPALTGTIQLGFLQVRLPATAPGQEYDVEITNLAATSDGLTALPLAGVTGRIARCSLRFSGHVTDAVTGVAIAGAAVCFDGGATCVQTDGNGFFGGLCYSGQSSAGAYVCTSTPGYQQSCQGPWTPSGNDVTIDFRLLPAGTTAACVGDCDGNDVVDITELLRGVNISLGVIPPAVCLAFDCSSGCGPGPLPMPPTSITCLIRAVSNALAACPPAPCTEDADCDDGNACTIDHCTPKGCTHDCVCV